MLLSETKKHNGHEEMKYMKILKLTPPTVMILNHSL